MSTENPPRQSLTIPWLVTGVHIFLILLTLPDIAGPIFRSLVLMFMPIISLLVFAWWLWRRSGLGRSAWKLIGVVALIFAISLFALHPSVYFALWMYGAPATILFITLALHLNQNKPFPLLIGCLIIFILVLTPFRIDGFDSAIQPDWSSRWAATGEDQAAVETAVSDKQWVVETIEWPEFRGPNRDSKVPGQAKLDWETKPPKEIWRIPIGPAWSSFSLVSGRLFTQEQRGEEEWVSCYDASNGALIWKYAHQARFTETISGAGPRGTPTYADGRIFAMGATGHFMALDAATGTPIWTRDLVSELNASVPNWAFSGSPLVLEERVTIFAGGSDGQGLITVNAADGKTIWTFPSDGDNYSSPQLVTLADTPTILFGDKEGFHGIDPQSGQKLWSHKPSDAAGVPIVQSQAIGANDLLSPNGEAGLLRLKITNDSGSWKVTEPWSTNRLKPAFNDFLFHDGQVYGYDKNIFACINAETGERVWKGGRYGSGQAILLSESAQILVTTEKGALILLDATPEAHRELGKIEVLKGKTWNHPIVANGRIYMRNGAEAVCLEL